MTNDGTLASLQGPEPLVRWTDLRVPFTRDRQGVAEKPDYDFANMGLLFPQNDATEIVYLTLQFPHEWVLRSSISPHIHYVQDEVAFPIFKMDYRWYENGGDPTGGFATLAAEEFLFPYVSGSILQIAEFPMISGKVVNSISSMLDIRVYRDDDVVAGDVLAKEFDVHFQLDSLGSRQEYVK